MNKINNNTYENSLISEQVLVNYNNAPKIEKNQQVVSLKI